MPMLAFLPWLDPYLTVSSLSDRRFIGGPMDGIPTSSELLSGERRLQMRLHRGVEHASVLLGVHDVDAVDAVDNDKVRRAIGLRGHGFVLFPSRLFAPVASRATVFRAKLPAAEEFDFVN